MKFIVFEALLQQVTVLIGITHQGRPIAGVVHQPYYSDSGKTEAEGRTVWGIQQVGTFGIKIGESKK